MPRRCWRRFPARKAFADPATARRALCRRSPRLYDRADARGHDQAARCRLRQLPAAARQERRRMAVTKSSAGRARSSSRPWRCCTRGRWRATCQHLSRLDNHDAELDTWIVAWVAHPLPRESAASVRGADPLSRASLAGVLGTHVRAVDDGRAVAVGRRYPRSWSTTS